MKVQCPECDGVGKVQEYISRTDYIATGGPDPVDCAECRGTGWVDVEVGAD